MSKICKNGWINTFKVIDFNGFKLETEKINNTTEAEDTVEFNPSSVVGDECDVDAPPPDRIFFITFERL